jgi:indole-3-glycerol phosphate synthase
MGLLGDILAGKRAEVDALRRVPRTRSERSPDDVVGALRRNGASGGALRLLAEVKLRSPSAGPLSRTLSAAARALAYAQEGAAMVSILCDSSFFDGSWEHLSQARARLDAAGHTIPLLAKEFVIDERQVQEARDRGAGAVLLIARIVDRPTLGRLANAAREEGLEPFIEVADENELATALEVGARVVGVNARDLDTLAMDSVRAAHVLDTIPREVVAVHFSGLREASDVERVANTRADAALVGEALMRDDDPRPRLRAMVEAARGRGRQETSRRA